MKNFLTIVVVIVLIVVVISLFQKTKTSQDANNNTDQKQTETTLPENQDNKQEEQATPANVVTVIVNASNYRFTPNIIRVKQGDTINLTFTVSEGFHNFVLDEFGVRTNAFKPGQNYKTSFVANKKGTFEYYCSVSNHRQLGMVGTLIVE